jgi:poly-gamma-glutamate capsule biosynthesis protein CapA/YwtB (metallophosphatase superfamily)
LLEKSPNSGMNRGALAECYAHLAKALGPSHPEDALQQYNAAIELLEHLTVSDASNAQYRIALADALTNEARLYVRMAGEEGAHAMRLENWTKARSLYQRS